jgi:hypothetical protein
MGHVLRLRNTARAIDELEGSYFYFSDPANLNDPMEGYVSLYWQGDVVVWKNLFKHYLLCLEFYIFLTYIGVDRHIDEVVQNIHKYNKARECSLYIDGIINRVFNDDKVLAFIADIASRAGKIYSDELRLYLDIFRERVLGEIHGSSEMAKNARSPAGGFSEGFYRRYDQLKVDKFFDHANSSARDELLGRVVNSMFFFRSCAEDASIQLDYGKYINTSDEYLISFLNFTGTYISALQSLAFPKWAIVSFMKGANNPISWAHYADGHKGVCLIFETTTDGHSQFLKIMDPQAPNTSDPSLKKLRLKDVQYEERVPEFDFFSQISILDRNYAVNNWYSFNEERSSFINFCSEDKFRASRLAVINKRVCTKLKAWEYEKETRLIYEVNSPARRSPFNNQIKIDKSQLTGVIFGFSTSFSDKVKIRNVIKKQNIGHVIFYQAFYNHENGLVEYEPIT